jgi:hypothetical protein
MLDHQHQNSRAPYFGCRIKTRLLLGLLCVVSSRLGSFPVCYGEETPPDRISFSDKLPYGKEEVDYFSKSVNDPVSRLQVKIQSGAVRLKADDEHGYLKSVLQRLKVPLESQLLVFSKTARAPNLVSPKSPRAIFFNDTVSVAWIPEAKQLELTAVDPARGINFYTLEQPGKQAARLVPVTFHRNKRCLACHSGRSSLEVPGLLLRGFQTDRTGKMLYGFSRITHDTTYDRRWGGWFVTGSPAGLVHRGNLIGKPENERHKKESGFLSSLDDLSGRVDLSAWPAPASDFVAHLVLSHQVHGSNLLIRVGMEARLNRHSDAQDRLIRYLVFADEPELKVSESAAMALRGTPYATWFQNSGAKDAEAGSLRELDLSRHVFRNRLSFLITTSLFDGLPGVTRSRILTRIWHGLTDQQPEEAFRHLRSDERKRIEEIVRATLANLPEVWRLPK